MGNMVIIAFCVWPAISLWLTIQLGAVRGLVATTVGGFLLLPFTSFVIADGLPPVTRDSVVALSSLICILISAPASIGRYRFHWIDLCVVGGMLAWGVTNIANDNGIQQALLDCWWFAMIAAIPYFLGRCVMDRPSTLPQLAVGIVAGSLMMVPFVLFELRMSPKLHSVVYGVWGNTVDMMRYGGWRPKVFQPVGLALAIWLAASAVVAWGLWRSRSVSSVWRISTPVVAGVCLAVGLLGRGGGAISLMLGGLATVMVALRFQNLRIALLIPAAVTVYIITAFADQLVPIRSLMMSAGELVWGESAGASLRTRIANEEFLVAVASQKPLLGWGGWGDFRSNLALARQMGVGVVLTDGLWVIVLGQRGLVGVVCLYGMLLVPGIMAVNTAVKQSLTREAAALIAGLACFCWIYAADLLFNAFPTPVLGLTAGALTSFVVRFRHNGRRLR